MMFSHAGDLGDLIYACPCISSMGGGDLDLYPNPGTVREPWTPEKVKNVNTLLKLQPYIHSVRYAEQPSGTILDTWRKQIRRRNNLSETVSAAFGQPIWNRDEPWLVVDGTDEDVRGKVVIHRSPRYQTRDFPWKDIVNAIGPYCVFVGAPFEHEDFVSKFGAVAYYSTPTLLDLARAIDGCRFFMGNQSTPRAIAEGLKKRVYVEESPFCPNTNFKRSGAYYGRREWYKVQTLWAASFRCE